MLKIIFLSFTFFIMACENSAETEIPPPQHLTREANGYYCLMTVSNHSGPKGQIILSDKPEALWFTSVRDTIAFTHSPEEPKNIAAIYVNDMSDASWEDPGSDNWIDARDAWYVVGSDRTGGMGAPELVPFSTKEKAASFASQYGGSVYTYTTIPLESIQ